MKSTNGFARLELVATLAAVALLGLLALPLLAASRAESDRAGCFNNLRRIGHAVEIWGTDRDGVPPWITFVSRGGTRPDGGSKAGNAWFEFTALSNELITPRILACPADAGVKMASEFSTDSMRGYMATGFRAQATSYFINMDNLGQVPLMAVTGDRNLRTDGITTCSQGVNNADYLIVFGPSTVLWTNSVHGLQGHLLRTDGGVSLVDSKTVMADYQRLIDDNGNIHLLRAR
jgi:competence protein ComGC